MSPFRDKQVQNLGLFLLIFILVLLLTGVLLHGWQTKAAGRMILSHDSAVASSLLEQGVSKEVIAAAITNTQSSTAGVDFLAQLGITKNSPISFIPYATQFQGVSLQSFFLAGVLLSIFLVSGVLHFLWQRERLYQQAAGIVNNYSSGDYSQRLPQVKEGTIYQMFTSIEQLATMLQSENDAVYRSKEFLKNTISDISHQLKTPLAALAMYQEIIQNEGDNPRVVKEFSLKAGLSIDRMEQLIQSMLKITRLDVGTIVFEKKKRNIYDLVLTSLSQLTTRAKKEGKEIVFQGDPLEMLICDSVWTGEAVGNLVKNALDHTEVGGIIRISWERTPFMTRIQISDNGQGINPQDIHHIFKRFYRSKHSLERQGVGLGLPLVKAIVEGQGGNLSVQSRENEGTTFILSFLTEM
ncbi:sensor histidine kinase [Anaerotignum sp. MB30-C6]|uniref:sensor histidine kinase n=1 Tax=Anaerotignum sp. MB30-C6 TaxID=3070814 RepID=UPI0027DC7A64|nr:HAMP domain-containing sensor histidine kinase [Anaerotignum sp. MB30-C6]WMI80995.1 HAMP domain-containing sensor histidine kinase [Anaerotignum sp. MB30-C6]